MKGCFLCFFQQILQQNVGWFLSLHRKTLFFRDFTLKSTDRPLVLLKSGTRDFSKYPSLCDNHQRF